MYILVVRIIERIITFEIALMTYDLTDRRPMPYTYTVYIVRACFVISVVSVVFVSLDHKDLSK